MGKYLVVVSTFLWYQYTYVFFFVYFFIMSYDCCIFIIFWKEMTYKYLSIEGDLVTREVCSGMILAMSSYDSILFQPNVGISRKIASRVLRI